MRTPGDLRVEPMQRRHLDGVLAIERMGLHSPWSATLFRRELERADRCYLVATASPPGPRRGRRVVGFAGTLIVAPDAHLTTMAVAPEHRRRGAASALLAALVADARDRGCAAMTLEVAEDNGGAIALYERFGFVVEGRRAGYYAELGQDALIMWCTDLSAGLAAGDQIESAVSEPAP